jgi:hypothetical protein
MWLLSEGIHGEFIYQIDQPRDILGCKHVMCLFNHTKLCALSTITI